MKQTCSKTGAWSSAHFIDAFALLFPRKATLPLPTD